MNTKDKHTEVGVVYCMFPPNRPWRLVYEDGSNVMRDPGTPKQFAACFSKYEQAVNFIKRNFRGWEVDCGAL